MRLYYIIAFCLLTGCIKKHDVSKNWLHIVRPVYDSIQLFAKSNQSGISNEKYLISVLSKDVDTIEFELLTIYPHADLDHIGYPRFYNHDSSVLLVDTSAINALYNDSLMEVRTGMMVTTYDVPHKYETRRWKITVTSSGVTVDKNFTMYNSHIKPYRNRFYPPMKC